MRISTFAWLLSALHVSSVAAATADVHCMGAHDPWWRSNCSPEDQMSCVWECLNKCEKMDSVSMARPDGNCDCWCKR
ncbi:hypothetical protein Cob_v001832 [Colletotrichum orbiculare MAFF 240422]|uniref:Uncharacterized protein n=1 Tax=Colletotrichum orbiculare (strain 104-T / ATCC 96160 / CBS 514.97 / LARS 414 / MAFF 240422) TaxID=1213857 RepID=A0A484G5P1_COLOR|nr:hypothetical protein Cob_v001832 [Colletotrichum orbiculare MAFF 240422]